MPASMSPIWTCRPRRRRQLTESAQVFVLPSVRWGEYWEINMSPTGSLLDEYKSVQKRRQMAKKA